MSNNNIEGRILALEKSKDETAAHLLAVASSIYKQQETNAILTKAVLQTQENVASILGVLVAFPEFNGTEAGAKIKVLLNRIGFDQDQSFAAISALLVSFQKPPPPPPGDAPTS